jgi:hypothetical protein
MNVAKKLLLSFFSIFLAFRSVELYKFIQMAGPAHFNWIGILGVSFALNLFITGVFALLGFAFLTNKVLPNSYYQIKDSKKLNMVYKILGVEYFKILLLMFFWGKKKNRKKYFDGTKTGIDNFDTQTRQSEFGHLAALITIMIVSFKLLMTGHFEIFYITSVINLVGNLYPIILQRTHRIQIERLKLMLDNRKQNFSSVSN